MNNKFEDGKNVPRLESLSKVTGSAEYLDDLEMSGMLYGAILRSPYAHAEVIDIDISETKKIEGVIGVLLPSDVPDIKYNNAGFMASPLLIKDEVCLTMTPKHQGDRIAAVVATTKEICEKALSSIKVKYNVLPSVNKIEDAIKEDSVLVHPEIHGDNRCYHKEGVRGNIKKGFENSDYVYENVYHTQTNHPMPMETVSCICHYTRDNKLNVWANSQTPFQDRRILSEILEMPECDISIRRAMIGGAFGHREQLYNQHVAALISKLVYKPVKIVNERVDEMISTACRHATRNELKMGVSNKGEIVSFHHKMYTDAGGYITQSPLVTGAPDRKIPYNIPNIRYDGIAVLTNGPVSGAFRGYGNPQSSFAREVLIDEICLEMNWEPEKFRYDNVCKPGDKMHANPVPLSTFPAEEVFSNGIRIKNEIDLKEGLRDDEEVKEAWGMSLISHCSSTSSLEAISSASIIVNPDATVNLMSGTADLGQGSETALVQVLAEKLKISLDQVIHAEFNTESSPYNYGSFSSGQAFLAGNAVAAAAEDVIQKLRVALAKKYKQELDDVFYDDGRYIIAKNGINYSFKEAIIDVSEDCRGTLIIGSSSVNMHDCPEPFALCWSKVAYNKKHKTIELKHVIESVDIGKPINLQICEGQLEGSIQMGVGYALMEDLEWDKTVKKITAADLLNFRNPLIVDMPKIHLYIADSYEPYSAVGAKSVGELGVIPVAASIANAVSRATGERIRDIPLSKKFFIKNCRYDDFFEGRS